jgi:hypothetical protein
VDLEDVAPCPVKRGDHDHLVAHHQAVHCVGQRSAAADLAWRARSRNEASRRRRLPWLVRLRLWRSLWCRRGCVHTPSRLVVCRCRPCRGRFCFVLRETALFVFAAGAARTGIVAPWSCFGRSSHRRECNVSSGFQSNKRGHGSTLTDRVPSEGPRQLLAITRARPGINTAPANAIRNESTRIAKAPTAA